MSGQSANGTAKRAPEPLSQHDALEILSAALAECTRSGLRVTLGSTPARGAVIILPGLSAEVQDGRAVFTVTPAEGVR